MCGRRADRPTSGRSSHGALGASAADRINGRDHISFMLESMSRPPEATPLRREASGAAVAVPSSDLV